MKQKIKLILGAVISLLGIVAFIIAANIPRTTRTGSSPLRMGAFVDNTSTIVGFQITGGVLLVVGILLLVFYFVGRKKA